jgi:hypothetical protein
LECLVWSQQRALPRPTTFERLITGPIADVERRRDRDEAIAEAIGFRLSAGLRRRPWTDLLPPDVCTMRLVASEGLHQIVVGELVAAISSPPASSEAGLCTIKLGQERWLMESVPYHLPGRVGAELLTSDPPDADLLERIRLPYRSVLVFFDQVSPGDVGYRSLINAYPRDVIAAAFGMSENDLPNFPFTEVDPLLVPRTNPIDPIN